MLVCLAAVGLSACGGDPRQDADEPSGKFAVSADATFPSNQKLAKRSTLAITVRNDENRRTIPNVAVTVNGFDTRIRQQGVADPTRPVFVINGRPKNIGTFPETKEDGPEGGETAYVNTWALGPLGPGKAQDLPLERDRGAAGPVQDHLPRGRRPGRQGAGRVDHRRQPRGRELHGHDLGQGPPDPHRR